MRLGIRKKLLLLTAILSLALILASVLVSSRLYAARLDRDKEENCMDASRGLSERISSEYIDFLQSYRDKTDTVYAENRLDLERAADYKFNDFDEKERFYSEMTKGVFPPKSGFGLSYEMAVFNGNYTQLLQELDLLAYSDGLDSATVFFYDAEHSNIVYLLDNASAQSLNYHFPLSLAKPWDQRLKTALERGEAASFFSGKDCYAVSPILSENGTGALAFVCYGSYNADSGQSTRIFFAYTFGILIAATALIGMCVMLFADKLIVKNIIKLSEASEKFALEIEGDKPEKVPAVIDSGDEIGMLARKFNLMQDSILGYIASLEEKTAKEEKLNAELELAARIQSESLPREGLKKGRFTLNSLLKPAREVGGDLYDYFMLDDARMFFCLADVSGKGIPAALFMMRAKELIRSGIGSGKPLGDFAFELNNRLCSGNDESIFITAFFGILDTCSGRLSCLRAGHEQPMLKRGGSITSIAEESNIVLGVFEDTEFIPDEITLESGDTLFMFTDGLTEGINERSEEFGCERIADALRTADTDIAGKLYSKLKEFCGKADQFDDVTLLVLNAGGELRLELNDPSFDDITSVTDAVLGELEGFDETETSKIGIIIDEIMNNQISYSFKDTPSPMAAVTLRITGVSAQLVFEDNGKSFDPLSEITQTDLALSEGGFGMALVRELSDGLSYERCGNMNRLTVIKLLQASAS